MDIQSTTQMLVDIYGEQLGISETERAEIRSISFSNKLKAGTVSCCLSLQKGTDGNGLNLDKIGQFFSSFHVP